MAVRPFAFGARLAGGGRVVRVRPQAHDPRRYVLEHTRGGRTQRRDHASLASALRDLAERWRSRHH